MAGWWRNTRGELYVAMQVVLMTLVAFAPALDRGAWAGPAEVYVAAGWIFGLAGGTLAVAGFLSLGRNLTPLPRPKDDAQLVVNGAYAFVRHPIYAGIGLAALGWALAWRSPCTLLFAAMLLVFFDIKSRREERWLREKYAGYAEYSRRVKKLVPFVY